MLNNKKDLILVYIVSFMDLFAVGLTIPLFSNHLRELGASHFTIGFLGSLYSGLQVISGPVVGSWSDIRDRKSVLQITSILCSVGYIGLGMANSILVIALVRILLGFTKHTQSICKALITDLVPPADRASAFGRSTAFGSLGFTIGPTLGGHLYELNNGFFYVCLVTSFLFVINIALTSVINEPKKIKKRQGHQYNVPIWAKLYHEFNKSITEMIEIDWSAFWDIFFLRFIFGFAVTMYFSQQSLYLKEQFDLSQRYVGYTISFFSGTGMASAFLLHYINNIFYKNDETCLKRLNHFFFLMTLSIICLCLSPKIELFLLFSIPFSISCTVLRIVSMELMLKRAAKTHRGSLSGTSNSIMSIARFVTPVSSGLITDKLGGHAAMIFAAVPPLVGTIVSFKMKTKNENIKSNKKEE